MHDGFQDFVFHIFKIWAFRLFRKNILKRSGRMGERQTLKLLFSYAFPDQIFIIDRGIQQPAQKACISFSVLLGFFNVAGEMRREIVGFVLF